MDSSTYRHMISKIKNSCTIAHHNFPSHNFLSVENLIEVSDNLNDAPKESTRFLFNFPCYKSFPYAIYQNSAFFCGSGVKDNANELVKKKLKWEKKLKNLRLYNVDKAIKQIKNLRNNKTENLSKSLRNYLDHFYTDPEPMFNGNYNWLYTGGTLSYVEEYNVAFLLSADSFEEKPGFNVLQLNETSDEIQYKSSTILKTCSPVLQITSKFKQDDLLICVRQKNHINLFSINSADCLSSPAKVWQKKVSSPKLITCADINANCEEVIISDSSNDIHAFSVEQKNKIYSCTGRKIMPDHVRDPWSQIAFGDHGVYLALRNGFVILDKRQSLLKTSLQYTPSPVINNCEEICSFAKSQNNSNFVYLGTTHSVLQLDLRNSETVQKWTHLMKKPPQHITAAKGEEGNEILMLQSQEVDEISGIVNHCIKNGDKINFISKSLPCLFNNMKESLKLVQFHGVCLSPFISRRISFLVTGMQCKKNNSGGFSVFTTNSTGDIFLSKIEKKRAKEEEDEKEILKAMKSYESELEKFPLNETVMSHLEFTDMSHVLKDLEHSNVATKKRKKPVINWKYPLDSLEFYKDVLAPKILRVWGFSHEESDFSEEVTSAEDKVRQWINMN